MVNLPFFCSPTFIASGRSSSSSSSSSIQPPPPPPPNKMTHTIHSSSSSSLGGSSSSSTLSLSMFSPPLLSNASTQLNPQDVYMWLALWMEHAPWGNFPQFDLPKMGCVLIHVHGKNGLSSSPSSSSSSFSSSHGSTLDRIVAMECTEHCLATQNALLKLSHQHTTYLASWSSSSSSLGGYFVLYCSRFPSTVCCKWMVQCGIQHCYYFPSTLMERDRPPLGSSSSSSSSSTLPKSFQHPVHQEAIYKLIQHAPLSLNLFVPRWLTPLPSLLGSIHGHYLPSPSSSSSSSSSTQPTTPFMNTDIKNENGHGHEHENDKEKDDDLEMKSKRPPCESIPSKNQAFTFVFPKLELQKYSQATPEQHLFWQQRFDLDLLGFQTMVHYYYHLKPYPPQPTWDHEERLQMYHALVVSHIVSRMTDDPKVGVGAVVCLPRQYISVGYNRYILNRPYDFPPFGSDEVQAFHHLKYPYILHAEQVCLLHPPAFPRRGPPCHGPLPWGGGGCCCGGGGGGGSCSSSLQRDPLVDPPPPPSFGLTLVSTKFPCDECAPILKSCHVQQVVSLKRTPSNVSSNPHPHPKSKSKSKSTSTSHSTRHSTLLHSMSIEGQCQEQEEGSLPTETDLDAESPMLPNGGGLTYFKLTKLIEKVYVLE
ncbi:Cytidine and dCMP deaminase domain-containing protein 1 [Coelomomyces lativittatus]|nr:Cytidine and dCMP deaminase domain-containing protein 1 [Coelomomyces lativittatus]